MKKGLKILFPFAALAAVLFGIHLFADSPEAPNPEKDRFYKEMTVKRFKDGIYVFKISRITRPLRKFMPVRPLPVPGIPRPPGLPAPPYRRPVVRPVPVVPVRPVREPVHPIIALQNKLKVKMLAPINQIKIEDRRAWDRHALTANTAVASMVGKGSLEKISRSISKIENQIKTINDWLARADEITMEKAKKIYDQRKRNIERQIERLESKIPGLVSRVYAKKDPFQKMRSQLALATAQARLAAFKESLNSFLSNQEEMIKKEFGALKIHQQNIIFQANIAKLGVLKASLAIVKGLLPHVKAIEARYRKAEKALFEIYEKNVLQ
jgi:polyhydroxyalkanoate synthesis regulator phasin